MSVAITCNGESRHVADGTTIEQLVAELNIGQNRFAVELNGRVVRRADHKHTTLKPDDVVNIVAFVGGG